jgi:hypothetical protein
MLMCEHVAYCTCMTTRDSLQSCAQFARTPARRAVLITCVAAHQYRGWACFTRCFTFQLTDADIGPQLAAQARCSLAPPDFSSGASTTATMCPPYVYVGDMTCPWAPVEIIMSLKLRAPTVCAVGLVACKLHQQNRGSLLMTRGLVTGIARASAALHKAQHKLLGSLAVNKE